MESLEITNKRFSILVIDDQPNNIKIISSFLNDLYTLYIANSGEKALKILDKVKPDLILLDIMMPVMNGYEVCQIIKKQESNKDIPVIFLSAKTEVEDIIKGFELGAVDYIYKPFNIQEVTIRIGNHLKLAHAVSQITAQNSELDNIIQIQKQTEKALRESEKRYRLLIETANEGVVVIQDSYMKYLNPIVVEITGYSEAELKAKPFSEFISEEDKERVYNSYLNRINGEDTESRYNFRLIRKDSAIKWIDVSSVMMEWEGHPAILSFLTDITERKIAEKKLIEAEQRNTALAMAITANHEINQPLMMISGNLEFIQAVCNKDLICEKYIKRIQEAVNRIDMILKRMRDIELNENIEFQEYAGEDSMISLNTQTRTEE